MDTRRLQAWKLSVLLTFPGLSCSPSEHPGVIWDEEPPSLTVSVDLAPESLAVARVSAIRAPDVQFNAILEPDLNHAITLTASLAGTITRIEPEQHARREGDLATIRSLSGNHSKRLVSPADGTWSPRRRDGQVVRAGDTLGLLVPHGHWLAVGSVSEMDYGVVHVNDPAEVRVIDRPALRLAGRVERVDATNTRQRWSAEVGVEFLGAEDLDERGSYLTRVTISPRGAGDSLLAIPAPAVVHLSLGTAVFLPSGRSRYHVQWVLTGPLADNMIVIRSGLDRGLEVVTQGVGSLATAAEDSILALARRTAPRQ